MPLSKSGKKNLYIIIKFDANASYFPICYSPHTWKWCIWYFISKKKNHRASGARLLFYMLVPFLFFGDPALFLPWIRPCSVETHTHVGYVMLPCKITQITDCQRMPSI